VWWLIPGILELGNLRQEDCELEASLSFIGRPTLKKTKQASLPLQSPGAYLKNNLKQKGLWAWLKWECFPSKCEALSSNPNTRKKKGKKGREGRKERIGSTLVPAKPTCNLHSCVMESNSLEAIYALMNKQKKKKKPWGRGCIWV
jgi:hypothetical protein